MKTSRLQKVVWAVCGSSMLAVGASAAQTTILRVPTLGGSAVDVRALNNSGALAGFSRTASDEQHAFLYSGGFMSDLGTLDGSTSLGKALSHNGLVAGESGQRAFLYSGGSMLDLGVLPGGSFSSAVAVNDAGDVAGDSDVGDFLTRGFLYRNGELRDIGSLGSGFSLVTDMNAAGDIVGESYNDLFEQRAFVFRNNTMTDLETLGGSASRAWAINDSGVTVGEAQHANGNMHAFRYFNGTMQDLGTLGGSSSAAYAVNNVGDILGDSLIADDADTHAFLFRGGQLIDLGTLGNGTYSSAVGLNNLGHVIGYSEDAIGMLTPFLWRDGTIVDLNTLLPPDSGWVLFAAYFINDNDQIVGFGMHNGEFAWYLLTLGTENQPPVASAGADQTVECGAMTHLNGGGSSDPDSDPLTFEWREGAMVLGYGSTLSVNLGLGTHTISLTVRDSHDASSDDALTVVVRDSTPPTLACPLTRTVAAGVDCMGVVPNLLPDVVVLDGCTSSSSLVKSQSPAAGTALGLGTHNVTVSVQDASGNVGSCTIALTVADMTAPTGDCPPAMTVSAGVECMGVVPDFTAALVASDNCTAAANLVKAQSPAAGTLVALGNHNVTMSVTDAAGNRSMCVTTLHVVDTTAPVVTCPPGLTALITTECEIALPDFTAVTDAADNCGGALVKSQSPAAGTLLGRGTHNVTVTVTDAAGNQGSCTTTFTVADRTAPVIHALSVSPNVLDDNRDMVPVTVSVTATDNCDSTPVSRILSITSDEPVTGPSDNTSPDWIVGSGLTGEVRAEASKKGDGRVYTITVVCTDVSGNSSTATTTVFVPGKQGGGGGPKDTVAALKANKNSSAATSTRTTTAKKTAKAKKK